MFANHSIFNMVPSQIEGPKAEYISRRSVVLRKCGVVTNVSYYL